MQNQRMQLYATRKYFFICNTLTCDANDRIWKSKSHMHSKRSHLSCHLPVFSSYKKNILWDFYSIAPHPSGSSLVTVYAQSLNTELPRNNRWSLLFWTNTKPVPSLLYCFPYPIVVLYCLWYIVFMTNAILVFVGWYPLMHSLTVDNDNHFAMVK